MANYLIVVEGEKIEIGLIKYIFSVALPTYRVESTVYKGTKTTKFVDANCEDNVIYVIKPKRNRLSNVVQDIKTNGDDIFAFNVYFSEEIDSDFFAKKFLIFDADYTSNIDIEIALNHFNDEYSNGLLVLSLPCIEALSDDINNSYAIDLDKRISETYKPAIKKYIRKISQTCQLYGYERYLCRNSFKLMDKCLRKNILFCNNDKQFMDHHLYLDKKSLPYIRKNKRIYPLITSFLYIVVGSILDFDQKDNPAKDLSDYLSSIKTEEECI